jgi:hypothetical protein
MAVQHQRAKGGRVALDTASRVWVRRTERGATPVIRLKTVNVLHSKQNVAACLSRTLTCILVYLYTWQVVSISGSIIVRAMAFSPLLQL